MITNYFVAHGKKVVTTEEFVPGLPLVNRVTKTVPWAIYEFFDDSNPGALRAAWDKVEKQNNIEGGRMGVFQTPRYAGPWDGLVQIGDFEAAEMRS